MRTIIMEIRAGPIRNKVFSYKQSSVKPSQFMI